VVLNEVPVNKFDFTHPGPHQRRGDNAAQGSAANDDDAALAQLLLPCLAYFPKDNLSRIPVNHRDTISFWVYSAYRPAG
jgi:hypothetical protein